MVAEIGRAANKDPAGGDVQMIHRSFSRAAFVLAVCGSSALLARSAANAADFSAEYVFGDSLSDNGNLASIGVKFTDPPSFHDSFTNGPVAVQLLAQSLGLSANPSDWLTSPSVPAGTNYAVGGATSALAAVGGPTLINLPEQVAAYSAFVSGQADPNALYVVMIGGNDVRNAALQATGAPAIEDGVNAELTAISTLAGEGAKHFLVVNVPNVGLIPEFTEDGPADVAADATTFSQLYNNELSEGLRTLEPTLATGSTLTDFDLYDFNASILADAAAHGFTNTTDPCFTNTPASAAATTACGPDGANVDQFLYWDDIHPTAPVQALWAQGFEAAVPEPSTWAMMLVGFVGLGFAGYRRGARAGLVVSFWSGYSNQR
jgi:phospholipase/lecithinase/hemolysin